MSVAVTIAPTAAPEPSFTQASHSLSLFNLASSLLLSTTTTSKSSSSKPQRKKHIRETLPLLPIESHNGVVPVRDPTKLQNTLRRLESANQQYRVRSALEHFKTCLQQQQQQQEQQQTEKNENLDELQVFGLYSPKQHEIINLIDENEQETVVNTTVSKSPFIKRSSSQSHYSMLNLNVIVFVCVLLIVFALASRQMMAFIY